MSCSCHLNEKYTLHLKFKLSRWPPPELVDREEDNEGGEGAPKVDDCLGDVSRQLVLSEFDTNKSLDNTYC